MSLILDALSRSQHDAEQVPGLDTQHYVEQEHRRSNWLQYTPWIGLLLACVIIAWLLLGRGAPHDSLPQVVPVEPATAPVAARPAPDPVSLPAPQVQPEMVVPAVPGSARNSSPPQTVEPVAVESVPDSSAGGEKQGQAAIDPAVAALYQSQAVQQSAADEVPDSTEAPREEVPVKREETIDVEQMLVRAQEQIADARLSEHAAPFIAELSQQTKDSIPTIYYQRHDYQVGGAGSSVVLNGKTLRTGGKAGAIKVEEILPDSVVLNHRGTQFRLRALNSWINL